MRANAFSSDLSISLNYRSRSLIYISVYRNLTWYTVRVHIYYNTHGHAKSQQHKIENTMTAPSPYLLLGLGPRVDKGSVVRTRSCIVRLALKDPSHNESYSASTCRPTLYVYVWGWGDAALCHWWRWQMLYIPCCLNQANFLRSSWWSP